MIGWHLSFGEGGGVEKAEIIYFAEKRLIRIKKEYEVEISYFSIPIC